MELYRKLCTVFYKNFQDRLFTLGGDFDFYEISLSALSMLVHFQFGKLNTFVFS